ncbi:MAG: hypothetical protein Q8O98_00095 [bacterium]|nr:hypothetical protein [bacterium]
MNPPVSRPGIKPAGWKAIAILLSVLTFFLLSLQTDNGAFSLFVLPFAAITFIGAIATIVRYNAALVNAMTESAIDRAKQEILQSLIQRGCAETTFFPDEPN